MKESPLISVLLCVYNGAAYVKEAIDSIIAQTYPNWELILIDDGSTDSTPEILGMYKDPRIRIYRQENIGLTKALNQAAVYASGDFFARQDADDISLPERFALQLKVFQDRPGTVVVSTDVEYISHKGEHLYIQKSPANKETALQTLFRIENPYVHGSLMFRREAFVKVGGYDESYKTSQDFELIVRMISLGEVAAVSKPLYRLRIHPTSITSRKWIIQIINSIRCCRAIKRFYNKGISNYFLFYFIIRKLTTIAFFFAYPAKVMYNYRIGSVFYKKRLFEKARDYLDAAVFDAPCFLPARLKLSKCVRILRDK